LPGPALTLVEEEIKPETTQRAFTEYRGVPLFHLITAAALITVLVLFLLYDSDEPERAVDSPIVIETISPESAISAGPAAPKPAKIKVDQDVLGASDLSEPSPESGPERDSKLDEAADSNPVNTLLVADAATIAEDANAESGNDVVLADPESAAAPLDAVKPIPLAAKDSKEDKPESVSSQVEIDSNPIPITEPARAISEQDRALKQSEDFLMAQSSGYVLQLVFRVVQNTFTSCQFNDWRLIFDAIFYTSPFLTGLFCLGGPPRNLMRIWGKRMQFIAIGMSRAWS